METKAVNVRMPMELYDRVKRLADQEYISVSGFIFNVLDKAIYDTGVTDVDLLEIQKTDKPTVSRIVSGVLPKDDGSGSEFGPGGNAWPDDD